MKAVVYDTFGGPEVLQLADVDTPAPGPNEVLVKVHAAALNPVDWHFVRGMPFPLRMMAGGRRTCPTATTTAPGSTAGRSSSPGSTSTPPTLPTAASSGTPTVVRRARCTRARRRS